MGAVHETGPRSKLAGQDRLAGGRFLFEDTSPAQIFTLEDCNEEQRQIAEMTRSFAERSILPAAEQIENKDFDVLCRLLRQAGELGLLGIDVPEEYGGLELDKVTSALIAEHIAATASFSVTFSAHTGIGMLPLVWYGSPEQKQRYLPALVSGEKIAAYALSESSSGSDALKIRASAVLSQDGSHYLLNGEKMWISNAGIAHLFTIFAKIDGQSFAAFLVEAGTPGLTLGPEEHKMGIRGSSTRPVLLRDCKVPVNNLLGEAGKGHYIAFNILNVGRYKLGAMVLGDARVAFKDAVRYGMGRFAFGKAITEFGMIQEKLAECASLLYAGESLIYRTVGSIDLALKEVDPASTTYTVDVQKRIEEFAVECSIVKVW